MSLLLGFLLLLSAAGNVVLVWYVRKLVKNLSVGTKGIDDLQGLLNEYCSLLEGMLQLDQYYGDDTVTGAVNNTKLVIEACKFYKKAIIETDEDEVDVGSENR